MQFFRSGLLDPKRSGRILSRVWLESEGPWDERLEVYTPSEEAASDTTTEPDYDSDLLSVFRWRTIEEHTDEVMAELEVEIGGSRIRRSAAVAVRPVAVRWHDWGKAHGIFQDAIRDDADGDYKRPPNHAGRRDIAKAAPRGLLRATTPEAFSTRTCFGPGRADDAPQRSNACATGQVCRSYNKASRCT